MIRHVEIQGENGVLNSNLENGGEILPLGALTKKKNFPVGVTEHGVGVGGGVCGVVWS